MTIEDLIIAGKDKVRSDKKLLAAYIEIFSKVFGRKPDCAGCTFNYDWERLIITKTTNIQVMSDKTFQLKDPNEIYTYHVIDEGSDIQRPVRTYGYLMSEEFAEKYLTTGSEEIIEKRKQEFKILPEKSNAESGLSAKTVAELKAIAIEKEYPETEWKSLKKYDLIAYLETKAIETAENND